MELISQRKDISIPYRGVKVRHRKNGDAQIVAYVPNGRDIVVGEYRSIKTASAIVQEIGMNAGKRSVYLMPLDY